MPDKLPRNEQYASTGPRPSSNPHYYKVKKGETLSAIASKLGVSIDELKRTNRLNNPRSIRTGQILRY